MEINKMTDVRGVVAVQDITEGRFVLITPNIVGTVDFGSRGDLPGVKLPANSDEAALAKYVVTWPVPYQSMPMYIPTPELSYSLRRGGFDQSANLPMTSTTIHLTWPGQKHGVTIPSGYLALAFGGGVFTLPSGYWVSSDNIKLAGASFTVSNTADHGSTEAGKPRYATSNVVGYVERYDSSNDDLEVRTLVP
jgi:hypothetical protein